MDLFDDFDRPAPIALPEGDGYSCEWDEASKTFLIRVPNGQMIYSADFLDDECSDGFLSHLQESDQGVLSPNQWREVTDIESVDFKNIRWKQDKIKMYGDVIPLPRLTSWYGDSGSNYTYSGISSQPNEWTPELFELKQRIEAAIGSKFNSVLLNWYRDGDDHLSWHADDEVELGNEPTIASVNFGATRDFILRRKDNHAEKLVVPLGQGSLLVMAGELQTFWEHSVPKRKKVKESRFNLTFRKILNSSAW